MNNELNLIHLLSDKIRDPNYSHKKFYDNPSIAFSVFRSLSSVSKQFVLMLLFVFETPLPKKAFEHMNPTTKNFYNDKSEVARLKIFTEEDKDRDKVKLDASFAKKLIDIFSKRYEPPFKEISLETNVSLESIMNDSLLKWRRIQQMIVKAQISDTSYINKVIIDVLTTGELIRENRGELSITSEGFQFILNSTDYQINAFIYYYAKYLIQKRKKEPQKIFGILCALNLCISEVKTTSESKSGLTYYGYKYEDDSDQKEIINDLFLIGLIWKKTHESNEFFITPLLSNFLFEKPHTFNTESNLNLIVETNFKIYAYSNSPFHTDLLNHFALIEYKLPNLIVASLTQKTIKNAFQKGIRREQIVKFLNKNVHNAQKALAEKEKMRAHNVGPGGDILEKIKVDSMYSVEGESIIPENVRQQLEMWEREKDVYFEEGGEDSD